MYTLLVVYLHTQYEPNLDICINEYYIYGIGIHMQEVPFGAERFFNVIE